MKAKLIAVALILTGTGYVFSQSFVNLAFENTTITSVPDIGQYVATIPGWIWNPTDNYVNGDPNSVPYNDIAQDAPAVDLEGTNYAYTAIQGQYSVLLQGGSSFIPQSEGGASIGQTGQIPVGSESITFLGHPIPGWGNTLQATFNGDPLTVLVTGSTATYNIYAANISADAGQTGLLQFSVPWESEVMIDDIQFSSSPTPEPSELALAALGTLLLGFRRWRNS